MQNQYLLPSVHWEASAMRRDHLVAKGSKTIHEDAHVDVLHRSEFIFILQMRAAIDMSGGR